MDTSCLDMAIKFEQQLNLVDSSIVNESERNFSSQQYDEDEDGYEFSFACAESASSPISADDLFHNGQIRSISPVFGNDVVQGVTSKRNSSEEVPSEKEPPVPVTCRKSNSTGFSKLWRFRDLLIRSQSDGKETFVFLTDNETTSKKKKSESSKNEKKKGSMVAESKTTSSKPKTTSSKPKTTSSSSYAMQYGKNGEKGKEKRRSYLPYRQDLVGFFTNASAVSRNIHPY